MEKREKVVLFVAIELILILITGLLYFKDLKVYTIFFATLSAVILIFIVLYIVNNRNEDSAYASSLKNIMKTYDSILVSSEELPDLKGKNILMVSSMEDFIDAQVEIRKPIYYKRDVDSCSFVIVDNNEACVHVMKKDESVISPLEIEIERLVKESSKKTSAKKKSILENIEKTTIIRLDNMNEIFHVIKTKLNRKL